MNYLLRPILTLTLLVGGGASAWLPATPAKAADKMATTFISPQIITVGGTVAVSGTWGVGSGGAGISVWLSSTTGQRNWTSPAEAGDVVASASADSAGAWGTNFIMPDRKFGYHEVFVQSGANFALFSAIGTDPDGAGALPAGLVNAAALRTLFPTAATAAPNTRADTLANALFIDADINLSPSSGPPGTTVTVRGSGFIGDDIAISVIFATGTTFENTAMDGITATSRGAFSRSFTVPDVPYGKYIITARGQNTLANIQGGAISEVFTVAGQFPGFQPLRLIPSKARPGGTVAFLARGLYPSAAVQLRYDSLAMTATPGSTTDAAGRLLASFIAPADTSYGVHRITVADSQGKSVSAELMIVGPTSLQLTANYQAGGDTVTVTGSGFTPSSLISFSLAGEPVESIPPAVISGADGAFAATVIVTRAIGPSSEPPPVGGGGGGGGGGGAPAPPAPAPPPSAPAPPVIIPIPGPLEPGYYLLEATDTEGQSAGGIYSALAPPAPLQAEISVVYSPAVGGAGNVYLAGKVVRFLDESGETVSLSGGIAGFNASVSYDPAGVIIKSVTAPVGWPLTQNTAAGALTVAGSAETGAALNAPAELFKVFPWLVGSKDKSYTVAISFNSMATTGGAPLRSDSGITKTFRRGDADGNGPVNIIDALFIAQYLAGLRGLGEGPAVVNPINAATPRNDTDTGSSISITDALYIAQMLAGLRDEWYNMT